MEYNEKYREYDPNPPKALVELRKIKRLGIGLWAEVSLVTVGERPYLFAFKPVVGNRHQEIDLLWSIPSHPNVVSILASGWLGSERGFLMEYCRKGDMEANKNNWNDSFCKTMVKDISQGISYLHSWNIIPYDLDNPKNILWDGRYFKLTDFGSAQSPNNATSMYDLANRDVDCLATLAQKMESTPFRDTDLIHAIDFALTPNKPFRDFVSSCQREGLRVQPSKKSEDLANITITWSVSRRLKPSRARD